MESDNTDNELTDELTDEQQESVAGGGGLEGQGGWRSANRPWICHPGPCQCGRAP
jgi:hypothetical protein